MVIPSYVHMISYKWLDESKIYTISQTDFSLFKKNIHDDREVLKAFSKVIEEADMIVAHNGDSFDLRKLRGRLLLQGLPPIPHTKSIDTLKIARRLFKLDWNSLDYLAKKLGHPGKKETPKGLWRDCFFGDRKAFKIMASYNRQDISALEYIYKKLSPHVKNINRKNDEEKCQNESCGSVQIQYRGYGTNKQGRYRKIQCLVCGSWASVKIKTV